MGDKISSLCHKVLKWSISLRKKFDENCHCFKIENHSFTFCVGARPFCKNAWSQTFHSTKAALEKEVSHAVAVVDGWVKTRVNTVYVRHDKKECELLSKGDRSDRFDGVWTSGLITHQRDLEPSLRQTANVRFKLRISQNRKEADKKCLEQFFWIKVTWNYLFISNKQ